MLFLLTKWLWTCATEFSYLKDFLSYEDFHFSEVNDYPIFMFLIIIVVFRFDLIFPDLVMFDMLSYWSIKKNILKYMNQINCFGRFAFTLCAISFTLKTNGIEW